MSAANLRPLTHSATLRRLLYEGMQALGLNPLQVYRQAYQGMPLQPGTADARLMHEMAPVLQQALPGLSGDGDIGLHLRRCSRGRWMCSVMLSRPALRCVKH